jgi:hypothetical protein
MDKQIEAAGTGGNRNDILAGFRRKIVHHPHDLFLR